MVKGNVVGTCVASAVVGSIVDGETLEEGIANSDISMAVVRSVENLSNYDNLRYKEPPQKDFCVYNLIRIRKSQTKSNKINPIRPQQSIKRPAFLTVFTNE